MWQRGDLVAVSRFKRRLALGALLVALVPHVGSAQPPVLRIAQAATIRGIVFDSIAQKPLVAAVVQLVNAENVSATAQIVESDTFGEFRFERVQPGRYLIGFLHPMLDSIGVERRPREIRVDGGATDIRVDLALPSPLSLRRAICGTAAVADSQSLILGIVRDADTRSAVEKSIVSLQWAEITLASGRLTRGRATRTFTTQETGWYALCGAPVSGTILLSATHGADSTEALEFDIPGDGFLRRDLYFGVARAVAADSTSIVTDSLLIQTGPRRAGDGRVSGTVVAANAGRALAGARVGIRNGPQTRTDERGAFTLTGIPTGTRMLDVRAVAHAPLAMPVDVVEGAAPLRITLVTLKSVLDTVKVRADLLGDRNLEGFMRRKRYGGAGRFVTAEDVAKRNPVEMVDMFRSMTGIMVARDDNQNEILVQRSMTSFENPFCRIAVYVNGSALTDPTVPMLNGYLRPSLVLGIELYNGGSAPPEFTKRNGCGSLVIWLR